MAVHGNAIQITLRFATGASHLLPFTHTAIVAPVLAKLSQNTMRHLPYKSLMMVKCSPIIQQIINTTPLCLVLDSSKPHILLLPLSWKRQSFILQEQIDINFHPSLSLFVSCWYIYVVVCYISYSHHDIHTRVPRCLMTISIPLSVSNRITARLHKYLRVPNKQGHPFVVWGMDLSKLDKNHFSHAFWHMITCDSLMEITCRHTEYVERERQDIWPLF